MACVFLIVIIIGALCGSKGDVISPSPDGSSLTSPAAPISPTPAETIPKIAPASPSTAMVPQPEAIPPSVPVVSHTVPPVFSPDHTPSGHDHSSVGSPSVPAPNIPPAGPANVPPSSSVSVPAPIPQQPENGSPNVTAKNINPPANSPIPNASPLTNAPPPTLPIIRPSISAPPPFRTTDHANPPTWSGPSITHIKGAPAISPSGIPSHVLPHVGDHAPVSSPKSPITTDPQNAAPAPLIPNLQPPKTKTTQPPASAHWNSPHPSSTRGAQSPIHPPTHSMPFSSHHSPLHAPMHLAPPSIHNSPLHPPLHPDPPSIHHGPTISPLPSPKSIPPMASMKGHGKHANPPGPRASSPIHSPSPTINVVPVPPPLPLPSNGNHKPIYAPTPLLPTFSPPIESRVPVSSPSNSLPSIHAPQPHPPRVLSPVHAPKMQPHWALPPPPPNLACSPMFCMDPLTYSPQGAPCACVQPMKVGLRLTVELYSFFPLVSLLAQEIASGTSLKQSQVRIMGANAGSEQPDKTIVLIDLVPIGERFYSDQAIVVYQKFWHKKVGIKKLYFGDYDVLYVTYPGLPPSPPMSPSNINVDDGPFSNDNHSKPEHPLGVNVPTRKEKLGGSLIAVIVLSSVIIFVLCSVTAWLIILKRSGQSILPSQSHISQPPFAKIPGFGPTIYGSGRSSTSGSLSSSVATYSAKTFSSIELEKATNKFDEANVLGEGGFGRVYQGTLEDGTQVAVKVLKREDQHGSREFLSEIEMLTRLHHRNLVKLIGICTEEHLRCLVYELIPNGSVESHLHGPDRETSPLDWSARMKIALGSARGLAYLHEDSNPRVIHRDFKSSNILLELDFTAKVSDFGLARTALEEGREHISTHVMGTFGYVAPEYAMTGHLLVKSDVYSYGVVLLELLTGRKPIDMSRPAGQENLVTWARPLLTTGEGLETLLDPILGPDFPFDSIAKVAAIASMCIQSEVSHRPFMGEVVQALKLVCNEHEGHRASESCSRDDSSTQEPEIRAHAELTQETGRALFASEIFSMPLGSMRNTSDSFRKRSSSGPLKTVKRSRFWQRVRGLSRRSRSQHGPATSELAGDADADRGWP